MAEIDSRKYQAVARYADNGQLSHHSLVNLENGSIVIEVIEDIDTLSTPAPKSDAVREAVEAHLNRFETILVTPYKALIDAMKRRCAGFPLEYEHEVTVIESAERALALLSGEVRP